MLRRILQSFVADSITVLSRRFSFSWRDSGLTSASTKAQHVPSARTHRRRRRAGGYCNDTARSLLTNVGDEVTAHAMEDELMTIDAIYGSGTLIADSKNRHVAVLTLPAQPHISIKLEFPADYPEKSPSVLGPASTGQDVAKGEGTQLAQLMKSVLQEIWRPGEPCVFTLIEEGTARLSSLAVEASLATNESLDDVHNLSHSKWAPSQQEIETGESPDWIISDRIIEKKSVFVARVASVHSPAQAKLYVDKLLATDKKVAKATHNITAWRIKGDHGVQYQDCNDDGETAAGGRLLHLLELVDTWNIMVVVTRWYGGVHLGPDRFRLINQAARDALVQAGFANQTGGKNAKR